MLIVAVIITASTIAWTRAMPSSAVLPGASVAGDHRATAEEDEGEGAESSATTTAGSFCIGLSEVR